MLDKRSSMAVLGTRPVHAVPDGQCHGDAANNPGGIAELELDRGRCGDRGKWRTQSEGHSFSRRAATFAEPRASVLCGVNGAQVGPFDLSALAAKVEAAKSPARL